MLKVYGRALALGLACVVSAAQADRAPPPRPELGVYKGAGCTGKGRLAQFEQFVGRDVERVIDFLDQRGWSEMRSSAKWIAECWSSTGKKLSLAVPMLPKDGRSTLQAGAAGEYNNIFREFAETLVRTGHEDAVIRIGWEFNGDWYPWFAGKDPTAFVKFWREIATTMRAVSGQKFLFEWCPNLGRNKIDPTSVYPGDDVVDVIAVDIYNQYWGDYSDPQKRWNFFVKQPFGLEWQRDFARQKGKLVAFPEWGTGLRPDGHGAGDDPYFIAQMADWMRMVKPLYHGYWDYKAPDYDAQLSDGRQPKAAAEFLRQFGVRS